MPRPKKVIATEEVVAPKELDKKEEDLEISTIVKSEDEKPPEQILIPHHIRPVQNVMGSQDFEFEPIEDFSVNSEVTQTKFEVHSFGEYVATVDNDSPELMQFLELNRNELNNRIQELWQTPSDPNDLIFFNFGEQKLIYNSYHAYFNQNGFAPVEPRIKSWMEYYLNRHNPITEEEIAIRLKGPLQYSFVPIKS